MLDPAHAEEEKQELANDCETAVELVEKTTGLIYVAVPTLLRSGTGLPPALDGLTLSIPHSSIDGIKEEGSTAGLDRSDRIFKAITHMEVLLNQLRCKSSNDLQSEQVTHRDIPSPVTACSSIASSCISPPWRVARARLPARQGNNLPEPDYSFSEFVASFLDVIEGRLPFLPPSVQLSVRLERDLISSARLANLIAEARLIESISGNSDEVELHGNPEHFLRFLASIRALWFPYITAYDSWLPSFPSPPKSWNPNLQNTFALSLTVSGKLLRSLGRDIQVVTNVPAMILDFMIPDWWAYRDRLSTAGVPGIDSTCDAITTMAALLRWVCKDSGDELEDPLNFSESIFLRDTVVPGSTLALDMAEIISHQVGGADESRIPALAKRAQELFTVFCEEIQAQSATLLDCFPIARFCEPPPDNKRVTPSSTAMGELPSEEAHVDIWVDLQVELVRLLAGAASSPSGAAALAARWRAVALAREHLRALLTKTVPSNDSSAQAVTGALVRWLGLHAVRDNPPLCNLMRIAFASIEDGLGDHLEYAYQQDGMTAVQHLVHLLLQRPSAAKAWLEAFQFSKVSDAQVKTGT